MTMDDYDIVTVEDLIAETPSETPYVTSPPPHHCTNTGYKLLLDRLDRFNSNTVWTTLGRLFCIHL